MKLEILSRDEIYAIHLASMEVLEKVGVSFHHSEALKAFKDAGAEVDVERKNVKIPEYLVKEAVSRAPSQVVLMARDPQYNLRLGGGRVHFTNGFGADNVIDLETGRRRPATLKDLENFTLMADYFPNVHIVKNNLIPQDVPRSVVDLAMAVAILRNTSKHCSLTALSVRGLRDIIRMGKALVGEEEFRKNPSFISTSFNNVPPLKYSEDISGMIVECSKNRIPFAISTGLLAGASGPATLAGALVQGNSEDLAALVLSQLIGPGTPVLWGSCATIMDQRFGTPAYGSPENGLIHLAFIQLAHYYGLPYYGAAGVIDSKVPDEQAAYECMMNALLCALAGAEVVHDGVYSVLETGKTGCYEQFVIGNEICSMITRILRGIEVTDETLAVNVIKAVGPEKNYLQDLTALRHTRKHLQEEHWQPQITDRTPRSEWERSGRKNIVQRAREKAKEILANHKPKPPLERHVEERLVAILRDRTQGNR